MQQPLDDPGKPARKGWRVKPLRTRLLETRRRSGVPWDVLERDYLLSWILAGIDRVASLRDTLVFKGGTALKKCYFGDYRFSVDIDFSGVQGVPVGEAMELAVMEACEEAVKFMDEYAPVDVHCDRYREKQPHPGGQEAFTIRARFPWQRKPQTRVMIEITVDEKIIRPAPRRKIMHGYGEPLNAAIRVYALEEIVAEKLRAILQHLEMLESRGWSRSRARDYYDIWRVLGLYGHRMELTDFAELLREKCEVRSVCFAGPDDFFAERMLANVEKNWDQWLGPLVPRLPSFETVIGELRPQIADLLALGP